MSEEIHAFDPPSNYNHPAHWHEDFIAHLAWIRHPMIYVELGIETCRTFNRIVPFADRLIGVDINLGSGKHMIHSPKTQFINMETDEFAALLRKDPIQIDLLFIDADHSAKAVLRDFKNYFPFVSDQGLIILHDSYPESRGMTRKYSSGTCYKAIKQMSRINRNYEIMTLPFSPGLSICRKRSKHIDWDTD